MFLKQTPQTPAPPRVVDEATGEIFTPDTALLNAPPAFSDIQSAIKTARPLSSVAGTRPNIMNLRDHPELSGKALAVFAVRYFHPEDSEFNNPYVLIYGAVFPPDQQAEAVPVMLRTGAQNVIERLTPAFAAIAAGEVFVGQLTLTSGGRYWTLD